MSTHCQLFAYDSVNVPAGTTLSAVAKAAGATLEDIRDLNPHYLRGVTPPDETSEVRVPVGTAQGFAVAISAIPESERTGWRVQRIGSLRSAQSIADDAGDSGESAALDEPEAVV